MFNGIVINFSEPICSCKSQAIKWNILPHKHEFKLHVYCVTCDTEVFIPSSKLYASIEFEKPYDTVEDFDNVIKVDFSRG